MANTKIVGNAAVITSTLKLADIKKIEKSTRKDVLTLNGGEDGKTPIFMVGTTTYGTGNINACGAEFACASRDGDQLAQITLGIPADVADAKEYVVEKYGIALINLAKIEEAVPAVLTAINEEHDALIESIEG